MRSDSHPIEQEELMAYLDGELPVDRARRSAEHLEHCRECQGLAADFESVSGRLREWEVESGGRQFVPPFETASPRRRMPRWVWGLASTAALGFGLLLVPRTMNQSHRAAQAIDLVRARKMAFDQSGPMIARSAQLTLIAKEFDKARAGLEDILKRHKGYVGQMNVNAPAGQARTLDASLRIPSSERDAAIAEIKKLGRVESESQTGEDVTSEYVDLDARLTNARNTERRLTEVLRQRTGKLADVLDVEKEISRVRGEIEQMEAQKKALTIRVEFITLDVKITEDYRAELQMPPDSMFGRFRNAAIAGYKSMVEGVVGLVLFLLAYGPSLLLWAALLFFPARLAWKRLRRT